VTGIGSGCDLNHRYKIRTRATADLSQLAASGQGRGGFGLDGRFGIDQPLEVLAGQSEEPAGFGEPDGSQAGSRSRLPSRGAQGRSLPGRPDLREPRRDYHELRLSRVRNRSPAGRALPSEAENWVPAGTPVIVSAFGLWQRTRPDTEYADAESGSSLIGALRANL
jgi:hypothetical protein